jgi:GR25 family glycosyltransferase involved in LPS biosynthesis
MESKSLFPSSNTFNEMTYIINLPRRSDKKKLMNYKLAKMNILETDYQFYNAVDGLDPKNDNLFQSLEKQKKIITRGAFGLVLTYIDLLEDAFNKSYARILILEDDVNFNKDYHQLIRSHQPTIDDKQYDIIWLGANQPMFSSKQLSDINQSSTYIPEPHKNNYTYGTFSILINNTGINKMRKIINKNNILKFKPIDVMINEMIKTNVLKGIVINPFLTMPDVSDSDNMGPRDQLSFSESRCFNINHYDYLSQRDITNIQKYLNVRNRSSIKESREYESYTRSYERLIRFIVSESDIFFLLKN